jgi:hypothetical protein
VTYSEPAAPFDDQIPGVASLDPALPGALRPAATDVAADGVAFYVDSGWRAAAMSAPAENRCRPNSHPSRSTMRRTRRPLAVLAMVALISVISAGCGSNAPSETGTASNSTTRDKAVKFAQCMRDNGVKKFPDPDPSGTLTIEVVNGSSLDPDSAAWKKAIHACKDLQPPGFTGHKRSPEQQKAALKFAQCMRDNGVKDFPDPDPDGPLIDTNRIPSSAGNGIARIHAAGEHCGDLAAAAGVHKP